MIPNANLFFSLWWITFLFSTSPSEIILSMHLCPQNGKKYRTLVFYVPNFCKPHNGIPPELLRQTSATHYFGCNFCVQPQIEMTQKEKKSSLRDKEFSCWILPFEVILIVFYCMPWSGVNTCISEFSRNFRVRALFWTIFIPMWIILEWAIQWWLPIIILISSFYSFKLLFAVIPFSSINNLIVMNS